MRLETLRAKRSVSTLDTPSPPNKHFSRSLSTPTVPEERRLVPRSLLTDTQKENDPLVDKACPSSPHKHFSKAESTPSVREEHEYARMPTSDRARLEREQYEKRRRVPRSLLTDNQKESDHLLEKVRKCKNIDELVRVCTESTEVKQAIEDKFLGTIDCQLQRLCSKGDFGSVLNTPITDIDISKIAENAIDELRKNCPLLYKVLLMASSSSTIEKKDDWHLFSLYGIIMQRRSQHFNVLQRLVMAACVRYHAGNEVCIVTASDYF